MAETTEARLVRRYDWDQECVHRGYDYDDYDQICIDRLTGKVVVRYDLGDPANYSPAYGGWSKSEWLERKGLDPDEEIEIEKAVVPVPEWEIEHLRRRKEWKAQREKEEAEARDLHAVFPDLNCSGATGYCNSDRRGNGKDYTDWEEDIARPAIEAAGYRDVVFYDIERDSFGPLIRGVRAIDANGEAKRFFYG